MPIPETDRQIVLMDAPQLRQMRTIYAFGNPVAKWLLPIVGVLYLAALLLARRRPRMAVWIGALVAANAVCWPWSCPSDSSCSSTQLAGTTFGPASRVFYETLLSYLERGQEVVLWLGLIVVVAGLFAGAEQVRHGRPHAACPAAWRASAPASAGARSTAAGRWVETNVAWLRVAVVALGVVVLLWGNNVSTDRLWWSLALVLALLAGLQVLVGAGRDRVQAGSPGPDLVTT